MNVTLAFSVTRWPGVDGEDDTDDECLDCPTKREYEKKLDAGMKCEDLFLPKNKWNAACKVLGHEIAQILPHLLHHAPTAIVTGKMCQ